MKNILSCLAGILLLAGILIMSYEIQLARGLDASDIEWSRTYGGTSDDGYHEVQLVKPSTGGYAVTGITESFGAGGKDIWLIKTDEDGKMEWNKTYGGAADEWVLAIIETGDGGYALFGHTDSFGTGYKDFYLIKTDANGVMQWSHTYGGSGREEGRALVQTPDGGYLMAGITNAFGAVGFDFWLVKTDSTGILEWSKTFGTGYNDYAYDLLYCDGGFTVAGQTGPLASSNAWLVRFDSLGNHQWNKSYGGPEGDLALSAVYTSDGGYAMTGYCRSFGAGGFDFWLVKTNSLGEMEWLRTYGGTNDDHARYVIQTNDQGYAITGATESMGSGDDDLWLVKTDADGYAEWNQTYGGMMEEWGDSLIQTPYGAIVMAGWTKSYGEGAADIWLTKLVSDEVQATVDIDPNTLNLWSNGNWITTYIELPEGYDAHDIDISAIELNDTVAAELLPTCVGDSDGDGIPDLMVKFDRAAVAAYIIANVDSSLLTERRGVIITLTLTGNLDDGTVFEGSDTIRVVCRGGGGIGRRALIA